MHASGLNEKEMALLLILEQAKKLPPREGARQHAQEGKSWSEIAHQLGLEPAEAEKLIIEITRETSRVNNRRGFSVYFDEVVLLRCFCWLEEVSHKKKALGSC